MLNLAEKATEPFIHSNRHGRIQNVDHLPCDEILYSLCNATG